MATNFLQATGASTAGYFSPVTTIVSSEITSLGSSLTATSASIFTSSGSFGQAIWADVAFVTGGAGFTPAVGGFISGWFLRSLDGGTTFETVPSSAAAPPRPPDFTIPLSTIAYANANVVYGSGLVKMPWSPCKIQVQNNAGATLPSSATSYNLIRVGPVAVQY
jgi:hypothetical protein